MQDIFWKKNPDVDFFSGAAWFESSMKGQDPDCGQLEAELFPLFFFVCVFLPLRTPGSGKNELLKYIWLVNLFFLTLLNLG